jgi:outer membrane protein assembly factor BamB
LGQGIAFHVAGSHLSCFVTSDGRQFWLRGSSGGGGLVFVASREGNFLALDAGSEALWHFGAEAEMASPMSYAVDGRQYIAVSSSGALFSFALPLEAGNKNQPRVAKRTAVVLK